MDKLYGKRVSSYIRLVFSKEGWCGRKIKISDLYWEALVFDGSLACSKTTDIRIVADLEPRAN